MILGVAEPDLKDHAPQEILKLFKTYLFNLFDEKIQGQDP